MTRPSRSGPRRGSFDVDERAAAVFAPDTLLASQYFERLRARGHLSGEQRLMYAVIGDAVDVYLAYAASTDRRHRALFAEAERWIESDDRSSLYAFGTICDHLGLDGEYLRRGLHQVGMRARGEGAPPVSGHDSPVAPERRMASNE